MPKTLFYTEQQVEDEIERLKDSPAVKLALKERYIKDAADRRFTDCGALKNGETCL